MDYHNQKTDFYKCELTFLISFRLVSVCSLLLTHLFAFFALLMQRALQLAIPFASLPNLQVALALPSSRNFVRGILSFCGDFFHGDVRRHLTTFRQDKSSRRKGKREVVNIRKKLASLFKTAFFRSKKSYFVILAGFLTPGRKPTVKFVIANKCPFLRSLLFLFFSVVLD